MLLPWLWVGALGGLLETLLAGFAAAAIGAVAAMLGGSVARCRFPDRHRGPVADRSGDRRTVCWCWPQAPAGPACNLAVMLAVPLLGFVAAALVPVRLAVAGLIAVAVFGPLGFVEPDETLLLLGFHDVGYWALIGAAIAAGIAAVAGRARDGRGGGSAYRQTIVAPPAGPGDGGRRPDRGRGRLSRRRTSGVLR